MGVCDILSDRDDQQWHAMGYVRGTETHLFHNLFDN